MNESIAPNSMNNVQQERDLQLVLNDGEQNICMIRNEDKNAVINSYKVFPGIELIYYDMNLRDYTEQYGKNKKILDIDHCLEGRIEYKDRDSYYYLSGGDLAVGGRDSDSGQRYYPLGHFKGITVRIDLNAAPEDLSVLLDGVSVRTSELYEKFCSEKGFYVLRGSRSIEHIFSELYEIPENIRKGYCRLKILELMLFLSHTEPKKIMADASSLGRVRLAKDAGTYIAERMEQKVTVSELASHFHVSETQLKNCFKSVYGMSVHAYIREQKMRAAASMLKDTDIPVLEIAGKYGYDNGSKFAKAFREVMGASPNAYRNGKMQADNDTVSLRARRILQM